MPTEINANTVNTLENRAVTTALTSGNASRTASASSLVPTPPTNTLNAHTSADDSVSISDSGQKLQALEASIRSEPHVRVEVVREIQKRVQNGDFPIDVEVLAQQIINQEQHF
ncbi:MAG: flagellar biosynthesis anti-sigma factor FlgM [Gammaproteobacteria bacterium]